jgi:ribokinase
MNRPADPPAYCAGRLPAPGADHAPTPGGEADDLCVVGNLTIDVILRGVPAMPAWGQEVVATDRAEAVAGQAAYMAFAAARLGLGASIVSAVGDDAAGERIRAELGQASVGVAAVEAIPGGTTPLTIAAVRPDGERAFLSDFGCADRFDTSLMACHWDQAQAAAAVALVGVFNLPSLDLIGASDLLAQARRAGVLTVLDTGWDPGGWGPTALKGVRALLAETDVFLPNLDEAAALTGQTSVPAMLRALADMCPGTIIVKGGAEGSWALHEGYLTHAPAVPTRADNAVGAGDVYDAGFVAGYLPQRDLTAGMILGTGAASLYVSRRHDRFPARDQAAAAAAKVTILSGGECG